MTIPDAQHLPGHDVIASDGHKVGNVEMVLFDKDTERAVVAVVATGILGIKVTMIPLAGATIGDKDRLMVPYDRDRIHSAPHHNPDDDLTAADEEALFAHYGLRYPGGDGAARSLARWFYTAQPPTLS